MTAAESHSAEDEEDDEDEDYDIDWSHLKTDDSAWPSALDCKLSLEPGRGPKSPSDIPVRYLRQEFLPQVERLTELTELPDGTPAYDAFDALVETNEGLLSGAELYHRRDDHKLLVKVSSGPDSFAKPTVEIFRAPDLLVMGGPQQVLSSLEGQDEEQDQSGQTGQTKQHCLLKATSDTSILVTSPHLMEQDKKLQQFATLDELRTEIGYGVRIVSANQRGNYIGDIEKLMDALKDLNVEHALDSFLQLFGFWLVMALSNGSSSTNRRMVASFPRYMATLSSAMSR